MWINEEDSHKRDSYCRYASLYRNTNVGCIFPCHMLDALVICPSARNVDVYAPHTDQGSMKREFYII